MTSSPHRAAFRDSLHAEWTKLRSVRSTAWSLLSIVVLSVLFSAFTTSALDTSGGSPGNPGNSDIVMLGLSGVYLGQIGAVVLGVLVIAVEYGTGMIRTTFVANPRRGTVLAAKTAVVFGVVLAAGLVATLASFFVGEAILQGNGFVYANGYPAASLGNGPTLRAVLGTTAYLGALTLLGAGIAAILRSTAGAMTTALGLLYVPMIVQMFMSEGARRLVQMFAPMPAGIAVQATVANSDSSLLGDPIPIGPWAGLGVVFAYAAVALLVALWVVKRRDV